MTDEDPLADLFDRLEEQYPDAHALETQPEWMDSLVDAHETIGIAYARKRGATPTPMVELEVTNTVSGEAGWHRFEATDEEWMYPYADPPAGVVAALEWLRDHVPPSEYREWWSDQQ